MSRPMQIFIIVMIALIILKHPEVVSEVINGVVQMFNNPNG